LPSGTAAPTAATRYDEAAWDAVPAVAPRTSAAYPAIRADLRTQPDTFAAAFAAELLTQNYAKTSRADLLAWAQSEAAALTITQVPLAAADRNKALIVSLTSPDWDGAASTLVPSQSDWAEFASLHAWTSVTGVKVETVPNFPPANASFSDPLTLARLVTATVTLRSTFGASEVTSVSSVAFQVVLGTSLTHGHVFGVACTENYVQRVQS
jgi:hypothetical protein